jgi:hypothetical protein
MRGEYLSFAKDGYFPASFTKIRANKLSSLVHVATFTRQELFSQGHIQELSGFL